VRVGAAITMCELGDAAQATVVLVDELEHLREPVIGRTDEDRHVRYADITYVINRIRSRLTESDLSIEDEYQIDQLKNLVYFPIQYYNSSRIENTKRKLPAN
jgi:hypothetical protein